jgi:hypothetical protein
MSKNILDLSNIESKDLISELNDRGYNTSLLYNRSDVDMWLGDINEDRENDNKIELSDDDKDDILEYCVNNEWVMEKINETISDKILDYEK